MGNPKKLAAAFILGCLISWGCGVVMGTLTLFTLFRSVVKLSLPTIQLIQGMLLAHHSVTFDCAGMCAQDGMVAQKPDGSWLVCLGGTAYVVRENKP